MGGSGATRRVSTRRSRSQPLRYYRAYVSAYAAGCGRRLLASDAPRIASPDCSPANSPRRRARAEALREGSVDGVQCAVWSAAEITPSQATGKEVVSCTLAASCHQPGEAEATGLLAICTNLPQTHIQPHCLRTLGVQDGMVQVVRLGRLACLEKREGEVPSARRERAESQSSASDQTSSYQPIGCLDVPCGR